MEFKVCDSSIDYEVDGEVLATVCFRPCGEDMMEIHRTFVDDRLRGQGMAARLMEQAAQEMRRRGVLVLPACSYAAKWFLERDEYSDLIRD